MTKESGLSLGKQHVKAVPAARWRAWRQGIDLQRIQGSGPGGIVLVKDIETGRQKRPLMPGKGRVSSLARKLAAKHDIALSDIEGTGPRGKIMMLDVRRAIEGKSYGEVDLEKARSGREYPGISMPMSQMRKVIAKRISNSAFTAPHIYFFADIEMEGLLALRRKISSSQEKEEISIPISVNDFLIKAVALTLRSFPMLNASVKDDSIHVFSEINIGLAVALEEGLIVPAIPAADQLGLGRISEIREDLVGRAREGRLKLEEVERGTFTISSLAQFDILFFTAIINPPQSAILSVGKTCNQLALRNGEVIQKSVARFGLSVDHRIVDGAVAANFLQSLKRKLENPSFTFLHI
jgi:pyruvate dehydrogenase E2 component (dihydrolipoamide acetyltransferase)